MSGSVLPFLFGKPRGSGFTALQTAAPSQLDGGRIFINSDPILNLPRSASVRALEDAVIVGYTVRAFRQLHPQNVPTRRNGS